jgi:hypothetical protein
MEFYRLETNPVWKWHGLPGQVKATLSVTRWMDGQVIFKAVLTHVHPSAIQSSWDTVAKSEQLIQGHQSESLKTSNSFWIHPWGNIVALCSSLGTAVLLFLKAAHRKHFTSIIVSNSPDIPRHKHCCCPDGKVRKASQRRTKWLAQGQTAGKRPDWIQSNVKLKVTVSFARQGTE